ncbi:MAG: polysaccharide biosynthesis protein, partial [Gammaproteobacteria bacterium]|nr:polysaccharide biosynthesis protein [Gammaproteobacteria bacterium]
RFVMSVEQSVRLIIDSADVARGGEVFVTKMPVVRIKDLAEVMIGELAPLHGHDPNDIEITEIGVKPGEKLYEELMSEEETRRAVELEKYFAILPAFRGLYSDINYDYPQVVSQDVTDPYVSSREAPLSREALIGFLRANHLLDPHAFDRSHQPDRRYWPGDKEETTR